MWDEPVFALPAGNLVNLLAADAAMLDLDQNLAEIELRDLNLI
jgi:hypothetical protein